MTSDLAGTANADDATGGDGRSVDGEVLKVYTTEFDKLRTEQFTRMGSQNSAFNFTILVLTAAGAAIGYLVQAPDAEMVAVIIGVCLLLPLLGGPLACYFFDNEVMINAVDSYLARDRVPAISRATRERYVVTKTVFDFEGRDLPNHTKWVHLVTSFGRWSLFGVPTVLPLILATGLVLHFFDEVRSYSPWLLAFGGVIFLLDLLLCVLVTRAAAWVIILGWRRVHQEKSSAADVQDGR